MTTVPYHMLPGREFDYKIAFYCAPVMAGMKPANIVTIPKPAPFNLHRSLARIARPMGGRGLFFYKLAECERRVLLIVYNREILRRHLQRPENAALLAGFGYRDGSVSGMLACLARRVRREQGFPHEIGVFLGYPPGDVERFIRHKGQGYRLCGYWKVYGDVEEAKRIFSVYDQARMHFCRKVADGEEIYNITYGGCAV